MYHDVALAYQELRGRTGPISLTQYTLDLDPATVNYTKPIILLVDEFSASGGDAFAATLQDNARALLVGYRTMGAGGNVVDWDATTYTEGMTRVTRSLMNRKTDIITADFPAAPYVENIGVRPDVEIDYMTRDNLMNSGRTFVAAVTGAAVDYIASKTK
jgi:C-terminal processing protease CtpA/Prc